MLERFQEMMGLYEELKHDIRHADRGLYERWKAGGFLVDPDIVSMYPDMGKVVEILAEGEEDDEDEEAACYHG